MTQNKNINTLTQLKNIIIKLKDKTFSDVLNKLSKIEGDYIEEQKFKDLFEFIVSEVAKEFNISNIEDIIYNRNHLYTKPRQFAMLFLKQYTSLSPSEITSLFDNRGRQNLYVLIKNFNKMNRDNKYDRENFLETYDKINEKIKNYININSEKNI